MKHCHTVITIVLVLLFNLIGSPSYSAEKLSIQLLNEAKLCDVVSSRISQKKLVDWLFSKKIVSDGARDFNNDGTVTYLEKVRVIAEPKFEPKKMSGYTVDTDAENIEGIRIFLIDFLKKNGGSKISIDPISFLPDSLQKSENELLELHSLTKGRLGVSQLTLVEFLSIDPIFANINCVKPDATPEPNNGVSNQAKDETSIVKAILLRGKVNDLTVSNLKDAESAEISITADRLASTKAYQIGGVLGIDLGWETKDEVTRLIPFVKLDRRFTVGDTTDKKQTDNIGIGLLGRSLISVGRSNAHEFKLSSLYTTDREAETKIGSLNLTWIPSVTVGDKVIIGQYRGGKPILWRFGLEGIANGGRVFEDGGNTELLDTNNFLYAGGEAGLKLIGFPGSSLEPIKLSFLYRYLDGVSSQLTHIKRFESALSFTPNKQKNASISLKYINGRVDDTLVDEEFWKLVLGLKF